MSCQCRRSHGGVTNFVICLLITVVIFSGSFDSPSRGFLFIIISSVSQCSSSSFTVLSVSFSLTLERAPLTVWNEIFNFSLLTLFSLSLRFPFSLYTNVVFTAHFPFGFWLKGERERAWLLRIIWVTLQTRRGRVSFFFFFSFRTQSSTSHLFPHFKRRKDETTTCSPFNFPIYSSPTSSAHRSVWPDNKRTTTPMTGRRRKLKIFFALSLHNSPEGEREMRRE